MSELTAHWNWDLAKNGWTDWTCSYCGFVENVDIHVTLNYNYCPHCGRKMVPRNQDTNTDQNIKPSKKELPPDVDIRIFSVAKKDWYDVTYEKKFLDKIREFDDVIAWHYYEAPRDDLRNFAVCAPHNTIYKLDKFADKLWEEYLDTEEDD